MKFIARCIMASIQFSIDSEKARDLAQSLARRTGQPVSRLVELALERFDLELREQDNNYPMDAVWDLAEKGRVAVKTGTTSAHSDFYDDNGLPK
jgi:antitoxin VapB